MTARSRCGTGMPCERLRFRISRQVSGRMTRRQWFGTLRHASVWKQSRVQTQTRVSAFQNYTLFSPSTRRVPPAVGERRVGQRDVFAPTTHRERTSRVTILVCTSSLGQTTPRPWCATPRQAPVSQPAGQSLSSQFPVITKLFVHDAEKAGSS